MARMAARWAVNGRKLWAIVFIEGVSDYRPVSPVGFETRPNRDYRYALRAGKPCGLPIPRLSARSQPYARKPAAFDASTAPPGALAGPGAQVPIAVVVDAQRLLAEIPQQFDPPRGQHGSAATYTPLSAWACCTISGTRSGAAYRTRSAAAGGSPGPTARPSPRRTRSPRPSPRSTAPIAPAAGDGQPGGEETVIRHPAARAAATRARISNRLSRGSTRIRRCSTGR
jgi:hypothetical protein